MFLGAVGGSREADRDAPARQGKVQENREERARKGRTVVLWHVYHLKVRTVGVVDMVQCTCDGQWAAIATIKHVVYVI